MTPTESYTAYLETTTVTQARRITELQTALALLIVKIRVGKVTDKDFDTARAALYSGGDLSSEVIRMFKESAQ